MELAGRTALLTGATGGLGRAIAGALAERGATLVLSSRKGDELERLSASLPGPGHRTIVADLAEEGAGERLVAEAGEIDVLVANAGLPGTGRIEAFSPEEVRRALRVNLETPMLMARELAPAMSERGRGHMVFISSLAGKAATPRSSVYCATKFGLRGFALALREDLWGSGVGVSLVLPGFIREAGLFHDSGARSPLGTSSPGEVAEGVVRAIERNRGEVNVAPRIQVMLANLSNRRPELAGRLGHRRGGDRVAERVAKGQADKR